jgi:NAD(P)H dehydrogenase (quinone)
MVRIVVVYHSGYGHTTQVARAVMRGVETVPDTTVKLIAVDEVHGNFDDFNAADGIIFGCPTYMAGPSAPFKAFIDSASGLWYQQRWKDKIAAGFTNSGGFSGDKLATLQALCLNAMQHGMIWVGTGILAPTTLDPNGPDHQQINRLSSYLGVMTQSNDAPPEQTPPVGDLKTAELFGKRVAEITGQFAKGRLGTAK